MSDLILKNCRNTDNKIVNLIIKDGKIYEIKKDLLPSDLTTDKIIDIKENHIISGLIDPHVHLRDPGLTYKEDWTTGSKAAAHGGYTTVIDMPNTSPQTDTLKNFKEKKEIAKKKSYVDYALHAGVKTEKDVMEILEENPASYKIFMDLHENEELYEMFRYVSKTGKPLCLHCEDKTLVDYNIKTLSDNPENYDKTICYSYARSALAELIAVNRAIEYAKKLNLQLHLCHITTRQTLELIHEAKSKIDISIEVTPHHLFLDNRTYESYGIKSKTNPPLRDNKYNLTLKHLKEFDSIGTDHAPHSLDEKQKGTWDSAAGIPGLENTLPLLLTEVKNRNISLKEVELLTSFRPARIFRIPNKGEIKIGYDADITIVDMKKEGKINTDTFYTKGKYTPFENRSFIGKNIMTINRGNVICENDEVIKHENKYVYQ